MQDTGARVQSESGNPRMGPTAALHRPSAYQAPNGARATRFVETNTGHRILPLLVHRLWPVGRGAARPRVGTAARASIAATPICEKDVVASGPCRPPLVLRESAQSTLHSDYRPRPPTAAVSHGGCCFTAAIAFCWWDRTDCQPQSILSFVTRLLTAAADSVYSVTKPRAYCF